MKLTHLLIYSDLLIESGCFFFTAMSISIDVFECFMAKGFKKMQWQACLVCG